MFTGRSIHANKRKRKKKYTKYNKYQDNWAIIAMQSNIVSWIELSDKQRWIATTSNINAEAFPIYKPESYKIHGKQLLIWDQSRVSFVCNFRFVSYDSNCDKRIVVFFLSIVGLGKFTVNRFSAICNEGWTNSVWY